MTADPVQLVLGTAGHIDHGKTALVRALTGVDTDRLPEERARGITIELGFAPLDLEAGGDRVRLSVIDVPGHEGLVRTMVSGATGIDLVLLVVAADEGVMPQTREHAAICDLLGLSRGVVALTKTDLVPQDVADLAAEEARALIAGTALAGSPVVPVSATTGSGIDALRRTLLAAACEAGAILGGVTRAERRRLAEFGREFGVAFQLRDDALDYEAGEAALGKLPYTDLREGKVTLPLLLTLKRCTPAERDEIASVLKRAARPGESSAEALDLAPVIERVRRYRGVEDTVRRAYEHVEKAAAAIDPFPAGVARETLLAAARFAVSRDR